MNILMVSINFYPSIGGIEIITENLANEFVRKGHKVTIITRTPNNEKIKKFPFKVLRSPSYFDLFKAYKQCDVYIHQSISLKYVWPLLLIKKPFFIVYHQVGWEKGIKGQIKKFTSLFAHNICVSKTTANAYHLKKYNIIYNAYNDNIFKCTNDKNNRQDITFVGRLHRDKGVYLLIDAFNEFKKETKSNYHLNIIGDSSERSKIKNYAARTEFASDIYFLGEMQPEQISQILNKTHIQAVTSTLPYREAFGIVALEGLACGCIVIGSNGDGIEEALHSAGLIYKNGNQQDLCEKIIKAYYMTYEEQMEKRLLAKQWIEKRELSKVAEEYINLLKDASNI